MMIIATFTDKAYISAVTIMYASRMNPGLAATIESA